MKKGKQPVRDKIYGTQSQQLKGLTSDEYEALKTLCFLAKNLYNVGCYNVRQHYFIDGEYLSYQANYPLCKENSNYKLLNSNVAQQILKEVDKSFKSLYFSNSSIVVLYLVIIEFIVSFSLTIYTSNVP